MPTEDHPNPEMKLSIKYNGPTVESGRMDAVELGPAIFGVGKMFTETAKTLYGDETKVRLDVKADFEHGSFGIEFLASSASPDLLPGLTLDEIATIATLLGLAGGGGVLGVIRWLRGRDIDQAEETEDGYTLHVHDESLTINIDEYRAFVNPDVRRGYQALVEPMEDEGVDSVDLRAEGQEAERIERDERKYFEGASPPEEEVSTDESRRVLEVISVSFKEGNMWRFAEGEATYYAEIVDEDFLERVDEHEVTFGKGDALLVRMETRTTRAGGQLEYDRKILEVIEHMPGDYGDQLELGEGEEQDG